MPITVVINAHAFKDEYGIAASPEDIDRLKEQINAIKKSLSLRVSEETFNANIDTIDAKIRKVSETIQNLKSELLYIIEDGEWKKAFSNNVESAIIQLEKRYNDLNIALGKKMERLPQLEAIETNINAIFAAYGEIIKKIIASEGERVRKEWDEKSNRENLLSVLREEAHNISWEINHD